MKSAYFAFLVAFASFISTARPGPANALQSALSNDPSITDLREKGYDGLNLLLGQYDTAPDPKLVPLIDAVAGQHGALASRLFWYTDLEKAEIAARAQHKPILYLRMMGKLTDEYSCANSRFFRTVLYANAGVSRLLREQFVLVWCSERPVPVVTIDYGDGRVLKRTLTGNSIHYVLDAEGRVIDALPGLYDPKTFSAILNEARAAAPSGEVDQARLEKYFQTGQEALRRAYWDDVRRAAPEALPAAAPQLGGKNPDARLAMRAAVSKSKVEAPLLARISPQDITASFDPSIDSATDRTLKKVAAFHLADAALDESSIAVIRSQNPVAYRDGAVLNRTIEQFQQSIALDSVRNNYTFRRRILGWLRQSHGGMALENLNQRVYSELFLTPRSDPWLGLVPSDVYTALPADGCAVAPVSR